MKILRPYLDDIIKLLHIPTGPARLMRLLIDMAEIDGSIVLKNVTRAGLCDILHIERQTLSNYFHALVKLEIIEGRGRNKFQLNERLFSRKWRINFDQINITYIDGVRIISGSSSS